MCAPQRSSGPGARRGEGGGSVRGRPTLSSSRFPNLKAPVNLTMRTEEKVTEKLTRREQGGRSRTGPAYTGRRVMSVSVVNDHPTRGSRTLLRRTRHVRAVSSRPLEVPAATGPPKCSPWAPGWGGGPRGEKGLQQDPQRPGLGPVTGS